MLAFEEDFRDKESVEKRWIYREGERLGGLNEEENVAIANGLTVRMDYITIENQVVYTGGGLISKDLFGYGYYEVKGTLFGGTGGLHSSFWSMGMGGGDGVTMPKKNIILEIDGYEVDSGRPSLIGTNLHYYIGGQKTIGGQIGTLDYEPFDTSKESFVLGYEWLPNQLNWYLNGTLIRRIKNPKFYGPQNVWLTALASDYFDRHICLESLPGESSWAYFRYYNLPLNGVNMVVNSSFEYVDSQDTSIPIGWYKSGNQPEASMVLQTDMAYDGDYVLRHYHEQDYDVNTWLKISFLPAGTYTFEAKVKTTDSKGHTIVISSEHSQTYNLSIPSDDNNQWQTVLLKHIGVTSGECKIMFSSKADAGSELWIDCVTLQQVDGEETYTDVTTFEAEIEKPYLNLGEIRVGPHGDSGYYVESGNDWQNSGLTGLLGGSRCCPTAKGPSVVYRPGIEEPGQYHVWFYNVCYENRAEAIQVDIHHTKGCTRKQLSQKSDSTHIHLGYFALDKSSYVNLHSLTKNEEEFLSAESVIFEKDNTREVRQILDQSILMKVGSHKLLSSGVPVKISYRQKVIKVNDTVMVPLNEMMAVFGAGTIEMDEEEHITIFYQDYMIRFKMGSYDFYYKKNKQEMKERCQRINDGIYVPLKALVEAFGRILNYTDHYCLITMDRVNTNTDFNCLHKLGHL